MILTIDSGNTRTKWAVFNDANAVVTSGVLYNEELQEAPEVWANCSLAVISNVAGETVAHRLQRMLNHSVQQHWITPSAEAYGIVNAYDNPAQLGSDRWAALVGARHYTKQNCLVINAGTAMTMDALLQDPDTGRCHFAGGAIVPGFHMMQQVLVQRTHGVELATDKRRFDELPVNTEDAVYSGALMAMTGAIEQMSLRLQRLTGGSMHCMMSGGDAHLLSECLRNSNVVSDIVLIEDLVLRGLLVMGRELR
jgi:type III pantothenate kinase